MFIGRETELKFLNDKYSENGGQLIVLYGRRRVGKILFSYLLASSALPRERAAFFTTWLWSPQPYRQCTNGPILPRG